MKYYIAYGSNMSQDQMYWRCPNAELVGIGYLDGYALEFYLHATVEPSDDFHARVPVAIWTISDEDEASLDMYEGVPSYYTKETATAYLLDGTEITGLIYIMNKIRPELPTTTYFFGIADAYDDLGFTSEQDHAGLNNAFVRALRRAHDDHLLQTKARRQYLASR